MKLIIAGGREFTNYALLSKEVDAFIAEHGRPECIVHGAARGADLLGKRYAEIRGIHIIPFPADWTRYKLAAGAIRNGEMAKFADALIAFWDGHSTGTEDMIKKAKARGLLVKIIRYESI